MKAIRTNTTQSVELVAVDGRHHEGSSTPFVDNDSETRATEVVKDITERKQAEEVLHKSENRYRSLVEANPYGIQKIDASGIITYANPAYQKMLGYTEEELLGESVLDLIEPASRRDELREYLSVLVKEQPQPTTYFQKNRTKDGRVIDVAVDWNYDRDNEGRVVGFTSVLSDITERKQAEAELQRYTKRVEALHAIAATVSQTLDLEQLMDIALDKVLEVMDLDGGVIYSIDTETREIVLKAHSGVSEEFVSAMGRIKVAEADIQRWQEQREPAFGLERMLDPGILAGAEVMIKSEGMQSYVGASLWSKDMLRGVMVLGSRSERRFSPEELELLGAMGNQIAVAIENAELFEQTGARAEELKASEAKYRRLAEDINDGYMVVTGGKIAFANAKMAQIVGYELRELIGTDDAKLIPPESVPYTQETQRRVRQRRRVRERIEGPLLNKDGERVPVEMSMKVVEYDGQPALATIVRDITERKRAEEALQESEEMSRGMLESAATGIYIVQEGKFQYVSPMFEEISGYTSDELIGTYSLGYIYPEDREKAREKAIENLKGQSSLPYEFRFVRKDGEIIWIMDKVASIQYRQYRGERAAVGSFMDITERKRAEEELLRHTRRVEALHAIAATVSQTLDLEQMLDGALDKVIEVMEADAINLYLIDEAAGEVILTAHKGASDEFVASVGRLRLDQEEVERMMGWKESSVVQEKLFNQPNLARIRAAQEKEGLQSRIIVPFWSKGIILGAMVAACRRPREFTAEDLELLQAIASEIAVGMENARLFAEVKTHENELERTYEELKAAQEYLVRTERQKALAEMAGGVAHDFNNVLSIVLGRAQLALEDVKEPQVKRNLEIIEQSGQDAAVMVRRLQAFAGATVSEDLEALDLNQVVEGTLQMVEARRAESQLMGVEIDISANLGEVSTGEGNPGELREVLVNIIFNAMDALPEGGRITVKTAQEDSWAVLSISDTGIGMTEEVKRRVFDPFFTTKGAGGTGLGLSASHGIINKHGGSIEVDSTPGKGSTFHIRLPIVAGTRKEAREDNNISHANNGTRILLADDDPEVAEVLELMLRKLGYQVMVVNSGQEALDAFSSGDYDLVITDLYMPDLSGREVARAVKEAKAGVPVLLVSGWGLQFDPSDTSVDGVVAKPFSKEDLSQQISKVLGNRKGLSGEYGEYVDH